MKLKKPILIAACATCDFAFDSRTLEPKCAQLSIRNVVFVKDKGTNGLEVYLRFPQMIKHRATCTITLCSKLLTVELNQFHFNIIFEE